jgi:two-component system, cell cycle response regulator
MSLKVLLADESSTIKKAFQLALSEYAVEVKTVPSGLDVATVALDFHPDIIFADILLSKKNGYDTCAEIKSNEKLKSIPVVLMWSSFMDFNTTLADKSGATDKLEKPFDSQTLKELAKKYVRKLTPHPLDGLLVTPRLPDFTESETFIRQKSEIDKQGSESTKVMSTDSDEFQSVKLNQKELSGAAPAGQPAARGNSSGGQEIDHIHIETESFGEFEEVVLVRADQELDELEEQIGKNIKDYLGESTSKNQSNPLMGLNPPPKKSRFDEQLMREEIKMQTEKICWQIIPEITERVVREEIQKLMKNIEKSI